MRNQSYILLLTFFLSFSQIHATIPENKEVTSRLYEIAQKVTYNQDYGYYLIWNGIGAGIADHNGDIILPMEWSYFSTNWLDEYGFIIGGRVGDEKQTMYDVTNRKEIPYIYFDKLETSLYTKNYDKENCYFIVSKKGKKGIWKLRDSKLLVPCAYDKIEDKQVRSTEYWPVKNAKGLGLYGKGKEVIPCGKYSLILANQDGNFAIVSDDVYATYRSEKNPSGLVGYGGKFGIIDLNTGKGSGFVYNGLGFYGEGCIGYNIGGKLINGQITGGKWGYVDSQNNKLCDAIYDEITPVKDGAAHVTKNGVHEFFVSPFMKNTPRVLSKVDENIPKSSVLNENTFAFIIANENYINLPHSEYSINDGETLKKYCISSFGIPERNVTLSTDATYGNLMSILKRIEEISDVYDGEANFLIYFSGLGSTNPKTHKRALLPIDASPDIASTMLDIEILFDRLSHCKAKEYLCIFDAPFNGEDRSGNPINTGRGIAIKSTYDQPERISVVMPGDDGRSNSYEAIQHGLLTYCMLDLVQNNKFGSILNAIDLLPVEVKRYSFENYNKTQTVKTYLSNEN